MATLAKNSSLKVLRGKSYEKFEKYFKDDTACLLYLSELKWSEGYKCKHCGWELWGKGKRGYDRRCRRCRYNESPTAGTLFHKLKFGLRKAFRICFEISVRKKGMSSCEISRAFEIQQKTAWRFRRKVHEAMKSSETYPLEGPVEVDEFVIGEKEEGNQGRVKGKRKIVILGIETRKEKKVGRAYAKCIKGYSSKDFAAFFESHIDKLSSVTTDKWTGYSPLKATYKEMKQIKSNKGKNFPELHTHIMRFKAWLRGIPHHCSEGYLQGYLDEFHFRFNRRGFMDTILDKLLRRMVAAQPLFITLRDLNT